MSRLHRPAGLRAVSASSRFGLNAANFFIGALLAVNLPFLADLLRERGWRYDSIGTATAMVAIGVLLAQALAGIAIDSFGRPRLVLFLASLGAGVGYGAIPHLARSPFATKAVLVSSGISQAFFTPVLASLALTFVGHEYLGRMIGVNQAWNHAGQIAAALLAMPLVPRFGVGAIFASILFMSILAAASAAIIRPHDLRFHLAKGQGGAPRTPVNALLRTVFLDRRVVVLLVTSIFVQSANAPALPLIALYIQSTHGPTSCVGQMVVLAQTIMIPVVIVAAPLCDRWGRKPLFAIACLTVPLRLVLCSLTHRLPALVALQALDGIGAGIQGVTLASMCSDLTRERGGFNTVLGIVASPIGGAIGPWLSGIIVEHLGFVAAFRILATIAAAGAAVFILYMPETRPLTRVVETGPPSRAAHGH